jgi:uncharacterized GH25 family protein
MKRRLTRAVGLGLPVAVLLVWASPLLSHDFWLVPSALTVTPGGELVIHGQTSSEFPTTLSAVTVDRVKTARIVTSRGEAAIEHVDVVGNSLRLRHRPSAVGQALVAVEVHPRLIPESAESFREYLALEGAPEALVRYEREGILPTDSIVRRYAKYAKAVVEVGADGPRSFEIEVGHPLEFVALSDPSGAEMGGEIRFRLLFLGEPVPHARGHASVAESTTAQAAYRGAEFETDENGEFTLEVVGNGLWNVRALHIVPAPTDSGADWDVHWATMVWGQTPE